ncbi:MAG: bck1-like resistance to osmotic shock [Trizodia sp. TS-e1964]|nr:MAG: bck1-like resistance to osmotic shock [Trizodia sp. TS-e1964]
MQAPMISSPLKQTNEIDWIGPLKAYIRQTYGDDPERYAEECATLNRLRQDMRGAGKDSAAGRDLLYRYYGQLELLDLRFPVDENHIKISFTWFDAFTHKPTSQFSLAYEKASIIFNISAVLSCHAAHQNRSDDTGLKTAYHSFQASAGMFTYINENFLHAPSIDLSRETVKTLIAIMLAQGQEVFLEKQITDDKKVGLLAKLASQAGYLYQQAVEGVQENVTKAIFEKVWLLVSQIKSSYMSSLAQYYQALADNDANSHGVAISRLHVAEGLSKEASRVANSFPSTVPSNSNLSSETGTSLIELTRRHHANVKEKLAEFTKDNDFIYHQTIPTESSLTPVPKLPAAKAIPVSELYAGQDIQRIIGPDIFQKIVPMSVTESASMYDEEKAKLIRAETERVEIANGEMAASLDYLKLPGALNILKGGLDQETAVDEEFRTWCSELAGNEGYNTTFDRLKTHKENILTALAKGTKQLDMEESVCEKMRSKYGADWTQQPSSRLTTTLRADLRNYRNAIDEASVSDSQLFLTFRQNESDFEEMRSAGETDEADVLFQTALFKAGAQRGKGKSSPASGGAEGSLLDEDYGEGGISVLDQITHIEELLRRLNLVKRERSQVLKDLKEKVHNDDISHVLILNKKSISNQENQLFQTELEKFRSHQNRILQANHKQSSLMKELSVKYSELLQDKRVRSEQSKYESITRQQSLVMAKYKRVFQAYNDLNSGLLKAESFYSEMQDTVDSLEKNVEAFVNNRRSEGAHLLTQIEKDRAGTASGHADRERERLKELMDRMSMEPTVSPVKQAFPPARPPQNHYAPTSPPITPRYPTTNLNGQYSMSPPQPTSAQAYSTQYAGSTNGQLRQQARTPSYDQPHQHHDSYNPGTFQHGRHDSYQQAIASAPPNQQYFSQSQYTYPPQGQFQQPPAQQQQQQQQSFVPPGYVPPPPPPGPPPLGPQQSFPVQASGYPPQASPQRGQRRNSEQHGQGDPWAGLNAWR